MSGPPQVIVVGAGSSGLVTALELTRQGVRVLLVDRAPRPQSDSRGTGLQPRTLELLHLHGVADELVAGGHPVSALTVFRGGERIAEVDFTLAPSSFGSITLPQATTEGALRARLAAAGVEVRWGTELVGLSQDGSGVKAALRRVGGPATVVRAGWLVGADGAGSAVRELMGQTFDGTSLLERWGLMDATLDWDLAPDAVRIFQGGDRVGQVVVVPLGGSRYRVQTDRLDPSVGLPSVPVMEALLQQYTGTTGTLSDPTWAAAFRVHLRQVVAYRDARVLLVGDAAHIHTPAGAQGLNTGIQDAINLGWKLAHVIAGRAEEALLDTYEQERHPVAQGVLRLTATLAREPERIGTLDPARAAQVAALVSQCAITYRDGPLGSPDASPTGLRAGDRLPDVQVGDRSLYERLRPGLVVVAVLGADDDVVPPDGSSAVDVWLLGSAAPQLGAVVGVRRGVVVIRPDGHLGYWAEGEAGQVLGPALDHVRRALRLTPETVGV